MKKTKPKLEVRSTDLYQIPKRKQILELLEHDDWKKLREFIESNPYYVAAYESQGGQFTYRRYMYHCAYHFAFNLCLGVKHGKPESKLQEYWHMYKYFFDQVKKQEEMDATAD